MAIRVHRRTLHAQTAVVDAFWALCEPGNPAAWLDSAGERGTRRSILATGDVVELQLGQEIDHLRQLWRECYAATDALCADAPLGILGWLSYDLAEDTLGIEGIRSRSHAAPSRMMIVRKSVEISHDTGEVTAWALGELDEFEAWCEQVESKLRDQTPAPPVQTPPKSAARWRDSPGRYREMIDGALAAIRDGEVYQLCLTTEVEVDTPLSDVNIHRILRDVSPTHHQGLLRFGDISLISASPETFISMSPDGLVTTRPIKGTRPRGVDEESDRRLAAELVDSEKERAENLMIVDLMRNDLQKVCDTGSVQVTGLFDVETYSSVHQLVSTVTGQLAEGFDGADVLRACFPAGSMTGAPKHRAVTLLRDLESGSRGIYSGAWGWWRVDGSMEWAMTIRSAVWRPGVVRVGVGGGITWSSVPEQEIAEVGHKARRILEALGAPSAQYS